MRIDRGNELAWGINTILFVGATCLRGPGHHLRRTVCLFVFEFTLPSSMLQNEQESNATENQYRANSDSCSDSYACSGVEGRCMTAGMRSEGRRRRGARSDGPDSGRGVEIRSSGA